MYNEVHMRRESLLFILGIIVFVVPLLGIPERWRAILLFVLGAAIMLIALRYRVEVRRATRTIDEVYHQEHNPRGDVTPVTLR